MHNLILNLLIVDRMQPVFNDFNSTHSSLKQLNKLTFLFNPIKSKERVSIDGPKLQLHSPKIKGNIEISLNGILKS